MDLLQKARVATKLAKEMSSSPSTPALKRGLRKTQERQLTQGNLRRPFYYEGNLAKCSQRVTGGT